MEQLGHTREGQVGPMFESWEAHWKPLGQIAWMHVGSRV